MTTKNKGLLKKLGAQVLAVVMCVSACSSSLAALAESRDPGLYMKNNTGIEVWTASSNENIFREEVKEEESDTAIQLSCVRNEFESAQILLRDSEAFQINAVTFSDLKNGDYTIPADNLKYNFVEYEYLPNNSAGQNANTAVKSAPGYFPDALSNETAVAVEANSTQPVWVRVYVPKGTPAGIYTGTANLSTSQGDCSVPVEVQVYDVTIPDSKDAEFSFSFWSNLAATWDQEDDKDGISVLYGYEKYSEEWWALLDNIAQLMKDNRSNDLMINIPALLKDGGTYIDENGDYVFNWSKFDEYIQFFMDRGVVKRLEGYALLMAVYGQTYNVAILQENGDGPLKKATVAYDTEEGQKWLRQVIPALCSHLEEKDWDTIWMQHVGDEPFNIEPQTSKWSEVRDMIRACNSNIQCGDPYDNTGCTEAMINMDADIFFPLLSVHEQQLAIYDELKAQGKEVFMYTCLNPQGNWLNRYVDKPVWQMKTIGWLSYKRNISGHLHWGFNEWLKYGTKEFHNIGKQNYKGDNFTIYPDVDITTDENGEVATSTPRRPAVKSSIRYEAVRDACEDYEIFKILEQRDEALAKEIAGSIVTDGQTYTTDITVMEEQRQRLLEEAAAPMLSVPVTQQEGDEFGQVKMLFEELPAGHTLYYNQESIEKDTALSPSLIGQEKPAGYDVVLESGANLDWTNGTYLNVVEVDAEHKVCAYSSIEVTEAKMPMASTVPLTKPVTQEAAGSGNMVKFSFDAVLGDNIVKNPDFESGKADWTSTNYFEVSDTEGVEGSTAAQIGYGEGGCTQNVQLIPGATYAMEAWGKVSKDGEKGWVTLSVNSEQYILEFSGTEYAQQTDEFTVPENISSSRIFTWKNDSRYGGLDDAYFFADNISLRSLNAEAGDGHVYYYSAEKGLPEDIRVGDSKPAIYNTPLLNGTEIQRNPGEYVNIVEVDRAGKVVALSSIQIPYEELTREDLQQLLEDAKPYLSQQQQYEAAGWDAFITQYQLMEKTIADKEATLKDYNEVKLSFTNAVAQLKEKSVVSFMEEAKENGAYWIGQFGSEGYAMFSQSGNGQDLMNLPDYVENFAVEGDSWYDTAADTEYALSAPDGSKPDGVGMYFGDTQVPITISVDDSKTEPYYLTLYMTDFDLTGRSQKVEILDQATGKVLCTSPETISDFQKGVYQTYRVQGDVVVRISSTNPKNCVIQGVFFDKAEKLADVALSAPVTEFDKNEAEAQPVSTGLLNQGSLTVDSLVYDGAELAQGQDYTVKEDGLTLNPSYLSTLPEGLQRIDVMMSDGSDCAWLIQVTGTISKEALKDLYNENRGRVETAYTTGSWANFQAAMENAKAVLDNADATQTEVNEAAAALQSAVDGLVNISTLEYVLGIANGHVEAGDVDKLVPSAQEVFNKVLASAQAIYDDPDATQEQVDTAWKTLMYAIQAMGFVPGDKTELIDLVAEAKALDLNAYEDGAEKDAFTAALKAAEDLIADPDAMELDIDAAYNALNDAMQNLIPKPAAGDKTELKKVIDEADVKNSELDRYVDDAEAKQKFADALAAAKEVYEKDGATQDEIDQAKNNLLDAMTGLRLRADKDNLNKWLEDLKSIDLSQYTEESAAVVRAVIAKAEALAAQDLDENDQDLINAMVAEMAIAKAQLVPAPADGEDPENPKPGDGSGESSNPESSKPNGDGSSQNGTNFEGKEATDDVPTTGDATPIAALSVLALAATGVILTFSKRRK